MGLFIYLHSVITMMTSERCNVLPILIPDLRIKSQPSNNPCYGCSHCHQGVTNRFTLHGPMVYVPDIASPWGQHWRQYALTPHIHNLNIQWIKNHWYTYQWVPSKIPTLQGAWTTISDENQTVIRYALQQGAL